MAEIDNSLIFEVLKTIQAATARIEARLDRLEERMEKFEGRQTAAMHFEQSVIAHLTGINESVDRLDAQFVGVNRRLDMLEAR